MFLHDAQERTESWQLRHSPEAIATLGVWRWKGIQAHMEDILRECVGKRVIDFGGSGGPLGLSSIVVDQEDPQHQTLDNVEGKVDVIFTSHTLEHCEDLNGILTEIYHRLYVGGVLIAHVPAWTCERWRSECYENPNQSCHRKTFALMCDPIPASNIFCRIDWVLDDQSFTIEQAEYCGDDSIFILARK